MGTSHTFFATTQDFHAVLRWLENAGGIFDPGIADCDNSEQHEFAVHFESLGPMVLWPARVDLSDYAEGSARWRQAILTQRRQQENADTPLIDADNSPVAGVKLPYQRDSRFWVASSVWFPTANLRRRFPELGRICGRFERWLRKNELAYDNTKLELFSPYDYNLCMSGIIQKVYALPEAAGILRAGGIMIDNMVSRGSYEKFIKSLKLRGIDA